jgi:pyroglutamyl-peptidase
VPIVDGAGGLVQHLPIKAIVSALRDGDPGIGVANRGHLRLQSRDVWSAAGCRSKRAKGGFIHIPYLPEQAAAHPGEASMAVATVRAALETAIAVSLRQGG